MVSDILLKDVLQKFFKKGPQQDHRVRGGRSHGYAEAGLQRGGDTTDRSPRANPLGKRNLFSKNGVAMWNLFAAIKLNKGFKRFMLRGTKKGKIETEPEQADCLKVSFFNG